MVTGENRNTVWARAFMEELARAGVREICIAPGSRSTPLVLAAAGDERFRLFSVVDERSAGFFALGLGKGSGRPAAVITTSGTAAANLYPAVIEASQGEVPLLVLTADRPHCLRDTDGNQAMDQLRLFGVFPRAFFEVAPPSVEGGSLRHLRAMVARGVSAATGPPPGPVHWNLPFDKPLEPTAGTEDTPLSFARENPLAAHGRPGGEVFTEVVQGGSELGQEEVGRLLEGLRGVSRGLIVAGPVTDGGEVGPAVRAFAAVTGFPVLADPLSGARFGPSEGAQLVAAYDLILRSPVAQEVLRPDLVFRVGASPTSGALLDYLGKHRDQTQLVADAGVRWKDHLASARQYFRLPPAPLLRALVRGWEEAEERALTALEGFPRGELLEGEVLAAVAEEMPEGSNLLVANSMPVRDLDAFGHPRDTEIRVFGNRGVSGIDGLVSTALGLRAATGRPTVAVLGDLAFYHDMNGLLTAKTQGTPVVFVVLNNDGGGIFHTLPVRELEPAFTRYFATPHGLDFRQTAELYDLFFVRTKEVSGFREAFRRALEDPRPCLLEVRIRREETHLMRREVLEAVAGAMTGLGER
jgi:2-succinyl-5-enolpyruvyl-6-hydroxy-3-cyclohexene-1-carboxylate synthase